ncbi:RNA methyltransferase [Thiomicrospira microaerophila]|uniref:RNA methyltransferase n=1 Tax=Thiomicrospira microaerophila TaxID=406020 RepID=UPI00200BFDF5|nr:RNA methyltransferase [Thiomicrospira microaerophila]UQB41820.1 RNA methyltransferase [Thiomicrospira microaerophila]
MSESGSLLDNIRVVLVETSHPGNIGGVARAMKNMGLSHLCLVNPNDFPSHAASSRASGAGDLLAQAQVFSSLSEAIAECDLVVGASARLRKVAWPQLDVKQTAELAMSKAPLSKIALVFGREDSGLSNSELDLCHYLAHIPSNPAYSSLNLAAAVQVFCYECRVAWLAQQDAEERAEGYRFELASSEQMEGFYQHLQQALIDIEFLDPEKNARFMRRMRRLYHRAELDIKEVDILRGILTAAQRQVLLRNTEAKDVQTN